MTTPPQSTALEALEGLQEADRLLNELGSIVKDSWAHEKIIDAMIPLSAIVLQPTAPVRDDRRCTCHKDDNPPIPCAKKFAASECAQQPEAVDLEKLKRECMKALYTPYDNAMGIDKDVHDIINFLAANGMIKGQDLAWLDKMAYGPSLYPTEWQAGWDEAIKTVARKMRGE